MITYEYVYLKLPSPIVVLKKTEPSSMEFIGLLDLGNVFTYFSINLSYGDNYVQFSIPYKDIDKSYLPEGTLLGYIALTSAKLGENKEKQAHLLHFFDHLVVIGTHQFIKYRQLI